MITPWVVRPLLLRMRRFALFPRGVPPLYPQPCCPLCCKPACLQIMLIASGVGHAIVAVYRRSALNAQPGVFQPAVPFPSVHPYFFPFFLRFLAISVVFYKMCQAYFAFCFPRRCLFTALRAQPQGLPQLTQPHLVFPVLGTAFLAPDVLRIRLAPAHRAHPDLDPFYVHGCLLLPVLFLAFLAHHIPGFCCRSAIRA